MIDVRPLAEEVVNRESKTDLYEFVEDRLHRGGIGELAIADQSEEIVRKLRRELAERISALKADGRVPIGRLGGLEGATWIPLTYRPDLRQAWAQEFSRLEGWEFEALTVFILRKSGHSVALIPSRGKESGIDMYGILRLGPNPGGRASVLQSIDARVIAQIKSNRIGEPEVRLLKTDSEEFVNRRGRAAPQVDPAFWKSNLPILPLLVGASGLTSFASEFAAKEGYLSLAGSDMADGIIASLPAGSQSVPNPGPLKAAARTIVRNAPWKADFGNL